MRRIFLVIVLTFITVALVACTEADTVNHNISKSADSFEVERRIVFFNGITDKYLLTIQGLCSLDVNDNDTLRVTCKTDEDEYKRHYLGLSDNVSYFVEQIESSDVNPYHYRVIFRPESIVPDIDIQTKK